MLYIWFPKEEADKFPSLKTTYQSNLIGDEYWIPIVGFASPDKTDAELQSALVAELKRFLETASA